MSIDFRNILEYLLGIGVQIIILVVGYLIARSFGQKIIGGIVEKSTKNKRLSKARIITLEKLILNLYSYVLIFLFISMLFGIFDLPIGPLIASAGVLGLAVGFGAQGLVSDVVTGFFILLERQIEVGEYITIGGYDGVVEEVGLRTAKIRSFDGTLNFIPNRQIEGIANHSRGTMRALVDIPISYDSNIDETMSILKSVCERFKDDERFVDGPNVIGVSELGKTDLTVRIIGQTANMEQWGAERDIMKAVRLGLTANNIEHPYPPTINHLPKDE